MFASALSVGRRFMQVGTPTDVLLQRKLKMSKRRLMLKEPRYCKTTTSAPLCVMLMAFVTFMLYRSRYGADDDRMFR